MQVWALPYQLVMLFNFQHTPGKDLAHPNYLLSWDDAWVGLGTALSSFWFLEGHPTYHLLELVGTSLQLLYKNESLLFTWNGIAFSLNKSV